MKAEGLFITENKQGHRAVQLVIKTANASYEKKLSPFNMGTNIQFCVCTTDSHVRSETSKQ